MPRRPTPLLLVAPLLLAALSGCTGSRDGPYEAGYVPYDGVPPGPSGDPWGPYIREAARRFDVPEAWVRAVMQQESGGRAGATSRAGAMGLMQVMPATYDDLRARHGLGPDPYHPRDNVLAGTAYLREMYDRFGSPHFLAAYNAGPNRVDDYLAGGRELPWETQDYLARLAPRVAGVEPAGRARPGAAYAALPGPAIRLRPPRAPIESAFAPAATVSAGLPEGVVISYVPDPDPADLAPPDPPAAAPAAFAPALAGMDRARSVAPPPDGAAPPPPAAWSRLAPVAAAAPPVPAAPGGWAVQVAALPSATAARALADQAAGSVGLLGARAEVQPAPSVGLYRARVSGLTRDGAYAACARLRARGECIVVPSPG